MSSTLNFRLILSFLIRSLKVFLFIILSIFIFAVFNNLCVLDMSGLISAQQVNIWSYRILIHSSFCCTFNRLFLNIVLFKHPAVSLPSEPDPLIFL